MKSFKDYLAESEHEYSNPVAGDVFEINCKEDTLIESYVVESDEYRIVLASDQRMLDILESFGYEIEDVCETCNETMCECNEGVSTDYQLPMEDGTGGQMFGNTLEETDDEPHPMERAVLHRILMQHSGLLEKFGPEAVMDAVRDECEWIGDVDEIGSSDVSAAVQSVIRNLGGEKVEEVADDMPTTEAKYQGREVPLNKPMRGDVAKSKVYVKDPKTGNIKKVNFGDKNMRIKKSNPARRKSFRARHNCANPGPKTKARYWSCRAW
jgi:hypothetical protein